MSEKSQRGGPGRGQGRKPSNPDKGNRVTMSFRFFPETIAELRAHPMPATTLVQRGLQIALSALGHDMPGRDECLLAYHAVGKALEILEAQRDAGGEHEFAWTDEQARLHALLSRFWLELRDEPTFWEREFPE